HPEDPFLFNRSRREAFAHADKILVLGTPFDFRLAYGKRLAANAVIMQVDLDYGELGHNRGVDYGITGDARLVLETLHSWRGKTVDFAERRRPWLEHLREVERKALEKDLPFLHSDKIPIHPLRLAKEINDFLTEDTIFIGDGGDVVTIIASVIQ